MTDNNHPITPPPELVQEWWDDIHGASYEFDAVATQIACWGADQELEACCEWVGAISGKYGPRLRLARRPKPPSLKEQALECLKNIDDACESEGFSRSDDTDIIRRALESLPD